jgi:hypothetical protein
MQITLPSRLAVGAVAFATAAKPFVQANAMKCLPACPAVQLGQRSVCRLNDRVADHTGLQTSELLVYIRFPHAHCICQTAVLIAQKCSNGERPFPSSLFVNRSIRTNANLQHTTVQVRDALWGSIISKACRADCRAECIKLQSAILTRFLH